MAETNFTPNLGEFIQGYFSVASGASPVVNNITIDGLESWLWTEGASVEMEW